VTGRIKRKDGTGREMTGGKNERKLMEEMDWMNKAEGWDWIGLEEKEKRKKMKESERKKMTG
jgi:hypothetical protein